MKKIAWLTVIPWLLLATAQALAADVVVTGAWARASPGNAANGAAYLTVTNPGGSVERLVAAASPVAARAELHEMVMDGGMMRMREVPVIELAPGQSLTLAPGGLHVMLMGLAQPLEEGSMIALTLTFERAGALTLEVPVLEAGSRGPGGAMPHGGMPKH
jgi:copper(I)-binding protein